MSAPWTAPLADCPAWCQKHRQIVFSDALVDTHWRDFLVIRDDRIMTGIKVRIYCEQTVVAGDSNLTGAFRPNLAIDKALRLTREDALAMAAALAEAADYMDAHVRQVTS